MRAAFLDRDGVINELVYLEEAGIIDSPFHEDQFRLVLGAAAGIRALNELDLKVIVISNQPVVAKGHCSSDRLDRITNRMHALLAQEEARLDAVYYCLHHPRGKVPELTRECDCRKPKPGLMLAAAREHGIDLGASVVVGDRWRDIEAGRRADCHTVFVDYWYAEPQPEKPDLVVASLTEATSWIVSDREGRHS